MQQKNQSTTFDRSSVFFAGLFLVCMTALFALFWPAMKSLVGSWGSEDFSYAYLLPFVFLYMLYANEGAGLWEQPVRRNFNYVSLAFFALGAVFYIAGKIGAIITFTYLAIVFFLVGLFVVFYGLSFIWRHKAAFIVLFFCITPSQFIAKILTFRLRLVSTKIAEIMIRAVDIPVYVEGNIIDLGVTQLQVVDACSGMRYFFPIIILSLLIAFVFRSGKLTSLLLLVSSPFVAVVANAFRLLVIAFGVRYIDPNIVDTAFHEGSGIIVYIVAGLCLMALHLLLSRLPFPGLRPSATEGSQKEQPSRVVVPSTVAIVILILLGVGAGLGVKMYVKVAAKVEPVYPLKKFSEFPATIGDWQVARAITLSPAELKSLGCDDYLNLVLKNEKTGNSIYFLMTYYNEQRLNKTAHPPTSCLLGSGWLINSRKYIAHPYVPDFTFQQVLLEKQGAPLISNFWFIQRGDIVASEFDHRWRMLWDGVVKRKTYGALVRTEMVLVNGQTIAEGQDLLTKFTASLTPVLKELIP